jgi:hypothetical protein
MDVADVAVTTGLEELVGAFILECEIQECVITGQYVVLSCATGGILFQTLLKPNETQTTKIEV